jgi:hypothetical protein
LFSVALSVSQGIALQSFLLGSMVPYVARTFLPLQK